MKWLILAVLCCGSASAQTAPGVNLVVPGVSGSLDLSGFIKSLHPVYVYDQHSDQLAGADIHVLEFHTAAGTAIMNTNAGVVWRASDGIGGPMASVRFRFDNLMSAAVNTSYAKSHITSIQLPQVEAGPFGGWISRLGWLYGVTFALAF